MDNENLSQELLDKQGEVLLLNYIETILYPIAVSGGMGNPLNSYCGNIGSSLKVVKNLYKDRIKYTQLGDSTLLTEVPELDIELLSIGGNTKFIRYGCFSKFFIRGSNPIELAEERIRERVKALDERVELEYETDEFDDDSRFYWLGAVIDGKEYTTHERDTLQLPVLLEKGKSMLNRNEDHYAWVSSGYFNCKISIDEQIFKLLEALSEIDITVKKCVGCDEKLVGVGSVCPMCKHKYIKCESCGEYHVKDKLELKGSKLLCIECLNKPRCRACGNTLEPTDNGLCERCESIRGVLDYHTGLGRQDESCGSRFKIGYEVEKEDEVLRSRLSTKTLVRETGWVIERDGSLDSNIGFELISPILPLDLDILEDILTPLERFLGAQITEKCGGHIHISDTERTPHEILLDIRGYLPLLYSLYPDRAMNEYCEAKEKDCYIDTGHRQALNITRNTLEFRIFPAVKNKEQLLFRTRLVKYMLENKETDVVKVGEELLNEDGELYRLLNRRISKTKLKERAKAFIDFTNYLDRDSLIIEKDKVRRTIEMPKIKIDKEKVFEEKALRIAEEIKMEKARYRPSGPERIEERDYGYFANLRED